MNDMKPNLLVVGAHNTDFAARAGGAIAKYVAGGCKVRILTLSQGARGESDHAWRTEPAISEEEVKRRREVESRDAAKFLGAEIHFLNLADYPMPIEDKAILNIVDEIREFKPRILLTHWTNEPMNPDHGSTGDIAIRASVYASALGLKRVNSPVQRPRIYFFEPAFGANQLSNFLPDVYLDISDVFEKKIEAIRKFKLSPPLPSNYTLMAELRASEARSVGNLPQCKYAEAYKALQPWGGQMFPIQ